MACPGGPIEPRTGELVPGRGLPGKANISRRRLAGEDRHDPAEPPPPSADGQRAAMQAHERRIACGLRLCKALREGAEGVGREPVEPLHDDGPREAVRKSDRPPLDGGDGPLHGVELPPEMGGVAWSGPLKAQDPLVHLTSGVPQITQKCLDHRAQ